MKGTGMGGIGQCSLYMKPVERLEKEWAVNFPCIGGVYDLISDWIGMIMSDCVSSSILSVSNE
jgi:hypothetical protein